LPSAGRTIKGLANNFNRYARTSQSVFAAFISDNLVLALDCSKEIENELVSSPLDSNQLEVSLGGNVIDFVLPYHFAPIQID
jgi:hypothetical protein